MNTGNTPITYKRFFLILVSVICMILSLSGCGRISSVISRSSEQEDSNEEEEETSKKPESFFGSMKDCLLKDKQTVSLTYSLPEIPKSDDSMLYLFAFELYETSMFPENFLEKEPIASTRKKKECELKWDYEDRQLFQKFVPALLQDGQYMPLSAGGCITNPELLSDNSVTVPKPKSKKGLLLDPQMLGTPMLTDLGVKYAIYNIPLSHIVGETTNEAVPTILYEYKGETYKFNGAGISGYDNLFTYLTENDMNTTAIILNDWNDNCLELIHPMARNKESGAFYYALNTFEKAGCRYIEAIASFLTERYSGKEFGLVSNWVIANEINQYKMWNYMETEDIDYYCGEFEKAMRIFYNAAKSNYSDANIYFSIDHDWYNNDADNGKHYNGKEIVETINEIVREKGNYDWGIAIHPYPDPLTKIDYWTDDYDKSIYAPILTMMNLSTLTDLLEEEEYLDRSGEVRSITVTELGFSSFSGEKLQAAAFAYCYYILDANPYVDAFIMNRQTDATEEVKQGLAFGIYDINQSPKYIFDTFKYIDTDESEEHTKFMLDILRADSFEEALSWAQ